MIDDNTILRRAALPYRVAMLETAADLTSGDRNKAYGEPASNHQHIADIFFAITGIKLTSRDVALMHVATKLARLAKNKGHQDSYVDAMAYLGIAYECGLAGASRDTDSERGQTDE
ncbi:DUF6378 domain-containing protein [Paracoccus sp. 22332]|uniref:DUF6378 domain-containing protein n=1 Tax=Paracoccus sp. 22332 TaxID=3453913 RepID=UPI003F8747D3